jgi:hypothetical protein
MQRRLLSLDCPSTPPYTRMEQFLSKHRNNFRVRNIYSVKRGKLRKLRKLSK